jgi:hypothetical protein
VLAPRFGDEWAALLHSAGTGASREWQNALVIYSSKLPPKHATSFSRNFIK